MLGEPDIRPCFGNNDDIDDGSDAGNESKFLLKLTEHNIHFLISFENYLCSD